MLYELQVASLCLFFVFGAALVWRQWRMIFNYPLKHDGKPMKSHKEIAFRFTTPIYMHPNQGWVHVPAEEAIRLWNQYRNPRATARLATLPEFKDTLNGMRLIVVTEDFGHRQGFVNDPRYISTSTNRRSFKEEV